jgi:hypothetical protein
MYGILEKGNARILVILPSTVFTGDPSKYSEESFATHCITHSWVDKTFIQKIKEKKLYQKLAKNKCLRKLLGKR